jgi:hypothetical protein
LGRSLHKEITYDKDIDGRLQQEDARIRDAQNHCVRVAGGNFRIRTSCRGIKIARVPEKVNNFKYSIEDQGKALNSVRICINGHTGMAFILHNNYRAKDCR